MPSILRRFVPRTVVGLMLAGMFCSARPTAAVSRRLDLAAMTKQAGTIVSGRIVGLREGRHPKYHNIRVLNVTVQVSQMLKGAGASQFTFRQFAGRATPQNIGRSLSMAQSLPDLPAYRVGEEVVLFLYAPSNVGFTSPVGGDQGMFLVRRQPGQPTTVISEGGTRSLAVDRPIAIPLNPSQQKILQHPGSALDYQTFLGTVKTLAKRGN